MTVEELQKALRLSDSDLAQLRTLVADYVNFDEQLTRSSPRARELANNGFNAQFVACASYIAKMLNLPISEVESLILALLGLTGPTAMTTGPSMIAISLIAQELQP